MESSSTGVRQHSSFKATASVRRFVRSLSLVIVSSVIVDIDNSIDVIKLQQSCPQ